MQTIQTVTVDGSETAMLRARFNVVAERFTIGGRGFDIFRPHDVDGLISEEEFSRDERLPYWAEIWASSRALSERVSTESGHGRRLLELGCGVGLVAAVAASVGFDVTATDYYPDALDFTRLNASQNGQSISATQLVDWRDFPKDLGRFDMVVASDVLYERPNAALVAAAFAATLSPAGLGIVADPQRRHATAFPAECRRQGLRIVQTTPVAINGGAICQIIDLYEIAAAQLDFQKGDKT